MLCCIYNKIIILSIRITHLMKLTLFYIFFYDGVHSDIADVFVLMWIW